MACLDTLDKKQTILYRLESNTTNFCRLLLETLTCLQGPSIVYEYIVVLDYNLADFFRLLKAQQNGGRQVDGSNWNSFSMMTFLHC
jgi:hypothetical protein